jgi:hypothetical protein
MSICFTLTPKLKPEFVDSVFLVGKNRCHTNSPTLNSNEIKHFNKIMFFVRVSYWEVLSLNVAMSKWEKVRTTKIRTSKTKKNSENSVDDQNVEMVFLVDQNVEIRTSKMSFELIRTTTIRTSKIAFKIKN